MRLKLDMTRRKWGEVEEEEEVEEVEEVDGAVGADGADGADEGGEKDEGEVGDGRDRGRAEDLRVHTTLIKRNGLADKMILIE